MGKNIDPDREDRRARRMMWALFIALIVFILALWYTSRPARGEEAEQAPTGRLAPLEDSDSDSAVDSKVAKESADEEVGVNVKPADVERAMAALNRIKGKISQPLYEAFEYAIEVMKICAGRLVGSGEVEIDPDAPIKRSEEVLFLARLYKLICKLIEEVALSLQESDKALAETQNLQAQVSLLTQIELGSPEETKALQAKLGALTAALAGKGELEQFEGTIIERASQGLAETSELLRGVTVLQADVRQHPQWAEADKRLKAADTAVSELSSVVDLNVKRFNEALGRITEQEEIAARLLEQRYFELFNEAGGPTPEVVEETTGQAAEILEDLEAHIETLTKLDEWAKKIEDWRQTVVIKDELDRRLAELEQKIQQGRPEVPDAQALAEWRATIEKWRAAHDEAAVKARDEDAAWRKAMEDWQKVVDDWRTDVDIWRQKTDQRLDTLEQQPATGGAPITVVTMYTINFNDGVNVESTKGTTTKPHEHDDAPASTEEMPEKDEKEPAEEEWPVIDE